MTTVPDSSEPSNGRSPIFFSHERPVPDWELRDRELSEWREDRSKYYFQDIGYLLQHVVRSHRYESRNRGTQRLNDPGWHPCSCGWEGYWHGFEPHVADELRALVTSEDPVAYWKAIQDARLAAIPDDGWDEPED